MNIEHLESMTQSELEDTIQKLWDDLHVVQSEINRRIKQQKHEERLSIFAK